jgi:hypothetical protein
MVEGDLTTLCRSCGLCCDGSLYGRAVLEPHEVEPARKNGLRVLGNGKGFSQPCAALVDRACAVYDARPATCRRFTCRLYERHRREGGPLEPRLAAVRRVRELLAALEGQRVVGEATSAPEFSELVQRLHDDFARAE